MDFLKTLLLYMTVTMATAVQDGPLPEDVPVPTVAPEAQVEQETPAPEGAVLPGVQVALPAVETASQPTAEPSPTITPNKGYSNITFGDRGNSVKKMQERLIELGYLPEGAADGAFGYQTNRALKEFQGNNGLNKDGVAGPATLTRLYEDPDVVALTTPVPEATDTPEPEADESVTIAPPEGETESDLALAQVPVVEVPAPAPEAEEQADEAEDDTVVPGLTRIANAAIVLGDSGSRLAALRLSDGVMQPFYPRVWHNGEGAVVVSLRDMAESINAWTLQIEEDAYTLEAAGYTVVLNETADGMACTVDGEALELAEGDAQTDGTDVYVTADFLREAMKANVIWDADENTLMLSVTNKEAAQAND